MNEMKLWTMDPFSVFIDIEMSLKMIKLHV